MFLALPLLTSALAFGPPDEVLTPTQPHVGEPAIAPAVIDSERAGPEPTEGIAEVPTPDPVVEPGPGDAGLPSWNADPVPGDPSGAPTDAVPPVEGPSEAGLQDWTAPVDPDYVQPSEDPGPGKGWGLISLAGGFFGGMIVTQIITGVTCSDAYCGTRGWPWRIMGLGITGFAGGGGWLQGKRTAWERSRDGEPPAKLTGRRVAGWTVFTLGIAAMVTDAALYQLCYDGAKGPYFQQEGFRYTCSPIASVVTLDLSTLAAATGLGLGLSGEAQRKHRRHLDLGLSPWGGRGQAGLSVSGRF